MKLSQKKYLLLSIVLLLFIVDNTFASCDIEENGRSIIPVKNETPVLYHASFKVYKYWFTGLIVFKYIPEQDHNYIVFLSEAGLNLAEFIAKDNTVECVKTMEVLDNNMAKKYLTGILQNLISENDCKRKKSKEEGDSLTCICKGKAGKHFYYFKDNNLQETCLKTGIRKRYRGYYQGNDYPNLIKIGKGKKTKIEFKLIKNAIK